MKESLVQEIEHAEKMIQSLQKFHDLGGSQSWWLGRKALAEELLSEVQRNESKT